MEAPIFLHGNMEPRIAACDNGMERASAGDGPADTMDFVCARGPWPSEEMFGLCISNVTLRDVFDAVDRRVDAREPGYIVTPNVDHICMCQDTPLFRRVYQEAFMVLADGMPLVWASRMLGKPLRQKISGSDLVFWLGEHAARKGHRVFYLGAAEGVAEAAAKVLGQRYPGLEVAGVYSPPLGFEEDPVESERAIERVRACAPDICFLALGSPKQEIWAWKNVARTGVPVMIGVGGALDFVTGRQSRAPVFLQKVSLEWLWRLCHHPIRLWRRYLLRDSRFLMLVLRELRRVRCR